MKNIITVILALSVLAPFAQAQQEMPTRRYEVVERQHTLGESASYLGILYGVSWAGYLLTQKDAIKVRGSWSAYKDNFGKLVVGDYDVPKFNWMTHVATGAGTYLLYRSKAYSREDAFFLTALQSVLFEFTIETYTEPASLEDVVNTPLLGSALGVSLEWASFKLLNTNSGFLHVVGHILNFPTLFGFYKGRVAVVPIVGQTNGVYVSWDFK